MPEDWSARYYLEPALAYVRGAAIQAAANGGKIVSRDPEIARREFLLEPELTAGPLALLEDAQIDAILSAGREAGLKLYRFKNTHDTLPRIQRTLGLLQGLEFQSLLDVGSGRGVFLWPFLEHFPAVPVTALDLLPERIELYETARLGGLERLHGMTGNLCAPDLPAGAFDVVTLLEVLEHIPEVQRAVTNAVRLARKYVLVSVPSKPDENPGHIHLLTREKLTELFGNAGCESLHFSGVPDHLIMLAALNPKENE